MSGARRSRSEHPEKSEGDRPQDLVRSPRPTTKGHRRRDRQHAPVIAAHQLPLAFVGQPVMPVTKKRQIVEISRTAMDPTHEVMRRTP